MLFLSKSSNAIEGVCFTQNHVIIMTNNYIYYIDTDEILGFLLSLKSHIFTPRSEDTIFIFHM